MLKTITFCCWENGAQSGPCASCSFTEKESNKHNAENGKSTFALKRCLLSVMCLKAIGKVPQ